MRFFHLADLHFGKVIYGRSLLEDQRDWVEKLLALTWERKPDAVVIAGDVYDRSTPSGAAMQLLSYLVTELSRQGLPVLITAGNHDSGDRLDCFRELLAENEVYLSGTHAKELTHVTIQGVTFWLMPYLFPAAAALLLEEDIPNYDTAVRRLLSEQKIDFSRRNVLIAHQNVTCGGQESLRGGSETMIGGVGQVEYTAFDGFDYVALGHIHAAYPVGRDTVRYAGSPLCYHFDEVRQPVKGPILVELGEKGTEPILETIPLAPLHPMRVLKGTQEDLKGEVQTLRGSEYVQLILTDSPLTPALSDWFEAQIREKGSFLLERRSEFRRFTGEAAAKTLGEIREKRLEELFSDFYRERTGHDCGEGEYALLCAAAELLRNTPAEEKKDALLPEKLLAMLEKGERK